MRPLIFGEVLFDRFPDGSVVLGGAPFNVAWHLHAFGLKPLMISRIGYDALGQQVKAAMLDWGMDCSGLQQDNEHPTGTVEVSFNDGEPSYEIAQDVAYDFIDAEQLPRLDGQWLFYHGSLALRHSCSALVQEKLAVQFASCRFVDINLRSPWWQRDRVIPLIKGADWLKLNETELSEIFPDLVDETEEKIGRLTSMIAKQIVLTGGECGATAISTGDGNRYSVVPERLSSVVDTVGAGDAFCSVFVAGQLLNWPIELCMQRAQTFASAVVGIRGATSRERSFYKQFIRQWGIKDQQNV